MVSFKLVRLSCILPLMALVASCTVLSKKQNFNTRQIDSTEAPVTGTQNLDQVLFINDPATAFAVRSDIIQAETEEINAAFHIWEPSGYALQSLFHLCLKARQGVTVKIVTDGVSFPQWPGMASKPELVKLLTDNCQAEDKVNNFQIRFWNLLSEFNPVEALYGRDMKRMHDKILWAKSQAIVYEGDRNWQNVNFRANEKRPGQTYYSIDAIIQGETARFAKEYFDNIWPLSTSMNTKLVTKESKTRVMGNRKEASNIVILPLRIGEYYKESFDRAETLFDEFLALSSQSQITYTSAWRAQMKPTSAGIKFVTFNPHERLFGVDNSKNVILTELLSSAKKSIYISTPFLRMPDELFELLKKKVGEGVKVELLTSKPTSILTPGFIQLQNRDIVRLQDSGVIVHQSNHPDDLHVKLIVVDENMTYLGTHNLNMRSFNLDLESGFVFSDPQVAVEMLSEVKQYEGTYSIRRTVSHFILSPILNILMQIWPIEKQF